MKKISLILAFILIFSVFASACDSSSTESSEYVSDVSEESSKPQENQTVMSDIQVSADPHETVISTGASYSTSISAGENYPDSYGSELTDGIRTTVNTDNYGDETLSGFAAAYGRFRIQLDLGFVSDKIYKFKLGYLSTTNAGLNAPASVQIQASIDGKKWHNLGFLKLPEFVEGKMLEAELQLETYATARYVRFVVQSQSSWIMIDEVLVIADIEGSDSNIDYLEAVNNAYQSLGAIARPAGVNDVNRDLDKILVSKGAKYETTATIVDNFKDKGNMLTDGNISGYYEGETWVGFEGGQDAVVKLDLGKTVDDIASIEASFYANTAVKIFMPVALKIAAIDESGNKTELAILYGNTVLKNGAYVYSLPLSKTISARYIEFTMVSTESNMYLVEEFAVYAYRENVVEGLYPPVEFKNDATEWGSEASNDKENLIANKNPQILSAADPGEGNYANNTPVTSPLLTDGKYAVNTDIHNGSFFKFSHGGGRLMVFDLDHISTVQTVKARFTQNIDWAVQAPSTVQILVSIDGNTWFEIGVIEKGNSIETKVFVYEAKLSQKVKARYVALNFPVAAWSGCDEIEVWGTKNSSGVNPSKYPEKSLISNKRIEPSDDLLGGAKDQVLLYQRTDSSYKVDDLMPYIAYLNADGEIVDTMFDSFLFLFIGDFPVGGGKAHAGGTKDGWLWALDDAFKDGQNLMALEEAAGTVKQELGLPSDFKFKVSLTLYYPSLGVTNFGDVDGDGVTENLDKIEDRIKVMQWYIDLIYDTYESKDFENVELVGYYWFHEAIEADDAESVELMNEVADMVHEKDCDFFWIPYFTANGYSEWAKYGFDCAVMQPNYVFELEAPYSNITNCANLTQLYGMGVEMEICTEALTNMNFFKKYMEYVAGGIQYGYMTDCIVMYYQSVYDFRDACNSGNIMGRMVYDTTYHFIKEDLQYKPATLEKINATISADTPYQGKIEFSNDYLRELSINVFPDHGSLTVNNDGSFTYYPETGFTGEVTFSFVYSEYLGWSDPCEVTITVE